MLGEHCVTDRRHTTADHGDVATHPDLRRTPFDVIIDCGGYHSIFDYEPLADAAEAMRLAETQAVPGCDTAAVNDRMMQVRKGGPVRIAIIATGGTFDKEYNEIDGSLFFRESHIQEMLKMGRCRVPVRIQVVMMKDSLEMDDRDRLTILEACRSAPESRIMITHGTDTMEHTARFLAERLTDKTIVLTGAMIPCAFGSSDGLFNFGSALSFAQVLPPGVFIAMNGCLFESGDVYKDRRLGIFRKRGDQDTSR